MLDLSFLRKEWEDWSGRTNGRYDVLSEMAKPHEHLLKRAQNEYDLVLKTTRKPLAAKAPRATERLLRLPK